MGSSPASRSRVVTLRLMPQQSSTAVGGFAQASAATGNIVSLAASRKYLTETGRCFASHL